LELFD
jgi:hypothetical protein